MLWALKRSSHLTTLVVCAGKNWFSPIKHRPRFLCNTALGALPCANLTISKSFGKFEIMLVNEETKMLIDNTIK